MQRAVFVVVLAALPVTTRAAEIDPAAVQLWDVIHTSDGSVLKGVIVEEIPGTSLRIVIAGGSSMVVPMANVVRLAKELNPAFERAASTPVATASAPVAAPVAAASGLRIAVLPAVAFHTEGDPSFLLNGRIGWEFALDRWGVTPGVAFLYAPRSGAYGEDSGGATAAIRAAYRASTVSPFIGFGIGVDGVRGDASLATAVSAGVDLVVHRRVALTAEGTFHRGFGDTYTDILEYGAFGMGIEVRL